VKKFNVIVVLKLRLDRKTRSRAIHARSVVRRRLELIWTTVHRTESMRQISQHKLVVKHQRCTVDVGAVRTFRATCECPGVWSWIERAQNVRSAGAWIRTSSKTNKRVRLIWRDARKKRHQLSHTNSAGIFSIDFGGRTTIGSCRCYNHHYCCNHFQHGIFSFRIFGGNFVFVEISLEQKLMLLLSTSNDVF
jgi:hypothetical protein